MSTAICGKISELINKSRIRVIAANAKPKVKYHNHESHNRLKLGSVPLNV